MQRTEAHIEIARPPHDVFAYVTRVPWWYGWHWDWTWVGVAIHGDGSAGTWYGTTIAVPVGESASRLPVFGAAVSGGISGAAVGLGIGLLIKEAVADENAQHDLYSAKIAVLAETDAPERAVFQLPWSEVDVRETYAIEATPHGSLLTCVEERGDDFFGSHHHVSLPWSRERKLHAGLRMLQKVLEG